jgi:endonuclease G
VSEEFAAAMYRLSDIARMTGVEFHRSLLDADQFDTVRGTEIALRGGARQKEARS